jgi:hypothetical protein
MAMNYASAVTMNNLVLALDQTARTVDMALASQEYACHTIQWKETCSFFMEYLL